MADSSPSELDQLRRENARLIAPRKTNGIAWCSTGPYPPHRVERSSQANDRRIISGGSHQGGHEHHGGGPLSAITPPQPQRLRRDGRGSNWRQHSRSSDGWVLTERGGGNDLLALPFRVMKSLGLSHAPALRLKRLAPLLATPAALLLSAGRAEAILTYNIFESGGNVVVEANGTLNLPGNIGTGQCGVAGLIASSIAAICTGPDASGSLTAYTVTGPLNFNGTVNIVPANSVSGIGTYLYGGIGRFEIASSYTNNTPIVSSATFNGTTLAGLGFTTTGVIGTWQLTGTPGPDGQINVLIGEPVPGPLPLFGAAAAFGWSRRLRRRLVVARPTPAV